MNTYKEYLQKFRKLEFETVCILINEENLSFKLNKFIVSIGDIKLNPEAYFVYYGEIKKFISSFLQYWSNKIDDCLKNVDKYSYSIKKKDVLELVDKTIILQQEKQVLFGNEYLPISTTDEKTTYEEIEKLYNTYVKNLYVLKASIEKIDKTDVLVNFVTEHFKTTMNAYRQQFDFTHSFIGLILADRLQDIKISLEEILLRLKNNLKTFQEVCDEGNKELFQKLYEKNKELIMLSRQQHRCSIVTIEIQRSIDTLQKEVERKRESLDLNRVKREVKYWEKQIEDFYRISETLHKLKAESDVLKKQQDTYNSLETTEYPGSKHDAWLNIGENYARHKVYLEEQTIAAAKTLITFFDVKGRNRAVMTNEVGTYAIDDSGHRVYMFDNDLIQYHTGCEGFVQYKDEDKYYYDANGRYVLDEEGKKLYKRAPCTSSYNLNQNDLFEKVTKDCGHSDMFKEECFTHYRDPFHAELLPTTQPIDIKHKLDKEVTTYLWNSFGGILPDVLCDVGKLKPKNPIHYIAHRLLFYKYHKTHKETESKKVEASVYKENILKDRQEKAEKEARFYKSKNVRRPKAEDFDDSNERAVYNSYQSAKDFIKWLDFYY